MTLRELVWMAESRREENWAHTATLLAMTANVHRNPKKKPRPFEPVEFYPFRRRHTAPVIKTNLKTLKHVFVDRQAF